MTFNKLNGRKISLRLLINLTICSIVAMTMYVMSNRHDKTFNAAPIIFTLVFGFGMSFFLIFYFAGLHAFNVSRNQFDFISSLNIFDEETYLNGYQEKETPIFYTTECICGKIDGYPVIISFSLAYGKGETSKLIFSFITKKFNRAHPENMSVELNWMCRYRPKGDVVKQVHDFVEQLKSKACVAGSIEDAVAGKYVTIVEEQQ